MIWLYIWTLYLNVIIIKNKVLLPQAYVNINDSGYPVQALCFLHSKPFNLFEFSIFPLWAYLMKVLQICVVRSKFDIWIVFYYCFFFYIKWHMHPQRLSVSITRGINNCFPKHPKLTPTLRPWTQAGNYNIYFWGLDR
jgi:hypothetical protein